MPTYEYECTKCEYQFEKFQSMTEEPLKRFPKCRCKVKRLIGTGAGLLFKGSGFYETDYRSDSYKKAEKKDKDTSKAEKPAGKAKKSGSKSKSSGGDGKKD